MPIFTIIEKTLLWHVHGLKFIILSRCIHEIILITTERVSLFDHFNYSTI